MAQKTQHVVTATLIVAKTGNTERYFERGAVLPDGVTLEERKRLVGLGLVKVVKVEETAEPAQTDPAQTGITPPAPEGDKK